MTAADETQCGVSGGCVSFDGGGCVSFDGGGCGCLHGLRKTKNREISIGPVTHPFVQSLAPLNHSRADVNMNRKISTKPLAQPFARSLLLTPELM